MRRFINVVRSRNIVTTVSFAAFAASVQRSIAQICFVDEDERSQRDDSLALVILVAVLGTSADFLNYLRTALLRQAIEEPQGVVDLNHDMLNFLRCGWVVLSFHIFCLATTFDDIDLEPTEQRLRAAGHASAMFLQMLYRIIYPCEARRYSQHYFNLLRVRLVDEQEPANAVSIEVVHDAPPRLINGINVDEIPFEAIPAKYICSITQDIMFEPVMTQDGQVYERDAILEWLRNHNTSPATSCRLVHKEVCQHFHLKQEIKAWVAQYAASMHDDVVSIEPAALKARPSG